MFKLYNTLTKKLEEFKPREEGKVKMYVCGPTVYDNAHLGHARCYITWDVLYRYLKFLNYDVTYCRNVTDVDDKILKKANDEGVSPDVVADKYYKSFTKSMQDLNVLKPDIEPYATKTINEMIEIVKKLIEKDYAYELDGDVYFNVKKDVNYGKLSGQSLDDLISGARVEKDDRKMCPLDFALWKKDEKHGYNSPWGLGRPGWHIECSAMSRKFLGESIDIHAGGADLIFPHHENEIAQSECANGTQFVKYWLHNGFVTINKEKMSKSLNNFKTIDDLLENYTSNTIRFFILTNHYRMPVEFSDEALLGAQAGAKRLVGATEGYIDTNDIDKNYSTQFKEAMDEDLNTSKALAVLFSIVDKIHKNKDQKLVNTLAYLAKTLGFNLDEKKELKKENLKNVYSHFNFDKNLMPEDVLTQLINKRNEARAQKNWALSDEIRDILDTAGVTLKDSKDGTSWEIK
jgi:cysteinyl-tRNA synthetase